VGLGNECVLCVGEFGAGLGEILCCVWDRLVWVWGSEYVLCGTVWGVTGGVSFCCVWESLLFVWGSEFVLCVRQFVVGLGE